jgi:hypothetical protein
MPGVTVGGNIQHPTLPPSPVRAACGLLGVAMRTLHITCMHMFMLGWVAFCDLTINLCQELCCRHVATEPGLFCSALRHLAVCATVLPLPKRSILRNWFLGS